MILTTSWEDIRNFIGIQQQSGVFADGYKPMPLSTGYDRVLAHRVDDQFAYASKEDGKVIEVSDKAVTIEYKDGTKKHLEIGRRFGKAKDVTIPHEVVANVKVGQKFKKGDILTYNSNFFQPDTFNDTQVLWKAGILVKTAVMESTDTLEDSSAISEEVAAQLSTKMTKTRDIVVGFDQTVRNLVKVGTEVDIETILCTIEDSVTADSGMFDEDSQDTLKLLASSAPKSKYHGEIEKIEVFYNGDKEDMSDSLKTIANASDRESKRLSSELGRQPITGKVTGNFRVDGNQLPADMLTIRVYITGSIPAGVGDKGVFCNQLKTIFGRVMSGENRTESGEDIGAIFGYQSISDRIVLSPIIIGTTNTLLRVIGEQAVDIYKGKK